MFYTFFKKILIFSILFLAFAADVYPLQYRMGGEVYEGIFIENNFGDANTLRLEQPNIDLNYPKFDRNEIYNILGFSPDLFVSAGKSVGCYLLTDIYWIHTWDTKESDEWNFELTNAYLSLSHKRISGRIGLQPFQFGSGLILYNDEPGITLDLGLARSFRLELKAAGVMETSPIASISFAYHPDFFEEIRLFSVWFRDEDDGFANLLRQSVNIYNIHSSGNLFWYGVGAELFIGDMYLSGTGILQRGAVKFEGNSNQNSYDISAYLIDIALDYNMTDWISVRTFCFVASGDRRPREGDLTAFVSPIPYNPRASIFFDPEFFDREVSDALSLGGMVWNGVVAPGVKFDFHPTKSFTAEITLATFYTNDKPSADREWYGWEMDNLLSYNFRDRHELFLEAAFFEHGDFYNNSPLFEQLGLNAKLASRFVIGFHTFF